MQDTLTNAVRRVMGYDVYVRRPSEHDRWEISLCERPLDVPGWPTLIAGSIVMFVERFRELTFGTPDDAARFVRTVLSK